VEQRKNLYNIGYFGTLRLSSSLREIFMQTVLVTGGSGFIGRHFCRAASQFGWHLIVLSRSPAKAKMVLPEAVQIVSNLNQIAADESIDVVVNLAGEPLAESRWTDGKKEKFYASRSGLTDSLYSFFRERELAPATLVSGSAIGYYGSGSDPKHEESAVVDGFSHQLCNSWEKSANQFQSLGTRVCTLRTGIVLGDQGALAKMLLPFKCGLGGPIGDGRQMMSWIHITDMVNVLLHCIADTGLSGPINATAPNPVDNKTFVKALGKTLHRPVALPMPGFMVRLLFGEMGVELLLQGQCVIPQKLQQNGFRFEFPSLPQALDDLLS
jgi:uncharacterized protein (TIGR01777 family)